MRKGFEIHKVQARALVARNVRNHSRRACTSLSAAGWTGRQVAPCRRRRSCSRHPPPGADQRRLASEEVAEPILVVRDGGCERQPRAGGAPRARRGDAPAAARDGARGRECWRRAVAGLQHRRRPAARLARVRPPLHADLPAWRGVEQGCPRARANARLARSGAGRRLRRRPDLTAVDGGVHRGALARAGRRVRGALSAGR